MKAFLAQKRAASLVTKKFAKAAADVEKLNLECLTSSVPYGEDVTLNPNQFFCVDASSSSLLSFGKSLKFEGVNQEDPTNIITKNNGYGATGLYVRVTNTGTERITVRNLQLTQQELYVSNDEHGMKSILAMKKEWEGTITTKVEKR